jgi:hypothetical protein
MVLGAVTAKTIVSKSDNCAMRRGHRIRAVTGMDRHRERHGLDEGARCGTENGVMELEVDQSSPYEPLRGFVCCLSVSPSMG